MTTLPTGLPVVVDRAGRAPLAAQISGQLEAAVTGGVLRAGDRLPSSRDLAASLGVSRPWSPTPTRGSSPRAGWRAVTVLVPTWPTSARLPSCAQPQGLAGSPAAGPNVRHVPRVPRGRVASPDDLAAVPVGADGPDWWTAIHARYPGLIDLQPGVSWADGIEPAAWRRAWRQAGAHLPSRWPDPHGRPELREEIAAYLRRSRGLAVTPEQVLVTRGCQAA